MSKRKNHIEEIFDGWYVFKRRMMLEEKTRKPGKGLLPSSQCMVLQTVKQHPDINVKEVASALGITSSAATQLIDTLVQKGYLKRKFNAEDRRIRTLVLSEKSNKQIQKMKIEILEKLTVLFHEFSDEELHTFAELNKKLIKNI